MLAECFFQKITLIIDDVIVLERWRRDLLAVKNVSILCMLLCFSCLRLGVMSYRILDCIELIPNSYSQ